MELKDEILEIKALIDQLREIDPEYKVFGACSHRYRIGPTLSDGEIGDFERAHKIKLPEDYRQYLKLVGDGSGIVPDSSDHYAFYKVCGAGPDYGLYPLKSTVDENRASEPFPHRFRDDHVYRYDLEVDWLSEYPATDDLPGLLEISHQGCEGWTHLVVSGDAFGTVWGSVGRDYFIPLAPSFTEWVRQWAEKHLTRFANKPLVKLIRRGMSSDQVVALTGNDWLERPARQGTYFENGRIGVQLTLDKDKSVTGIESYI